MSDIYLSITETPAVVTLSQPIIASSVAATVTVGNTVTAALDANSLSALENVTVTVGAAVSVSNFPSTQTIAGTVTANVSGAIIDPREDYGVATEKVAVQIYGTAGLPIGGTNSDSLPISGTVTANISGDVVYTTDPNGLISLKTAIYAQDSSLELQPVGANNPLPISGTITANNPNGALTTRFGSVATANLAFITSAVTNTSRKYLLAQNISAGTVTIGIGFSPTTTQGIQLSAGGGLTFDAFCPTGAVYWLGAVTGAAFTILEG